MKGSPHNNDEASQRSWVAEAEKPRRSVPRLFAICSPPVDERKTKRLHTGSPGSIPFLPPAPRVRPLGILPPAVVVGVYHSEDRPRRPIRSIHEAFSPTDDGHRPPEYRR